MNVSKYLFFLTAIFLFVLTGCATQKPEDTLARIITERVARINQQLPVQRAGVTLVRASEGEKHQIILQLYQSEPKVDGLTFIRNFAKTICLNPDTRNWVITGGGYHLQLVTAAKKMVTYNATQCGNL